MSYQYYAVINLMGERVNIARGTGRNPPTLLEAHASDDRWLESRTLYSRFVEGDLELLTADEASRLATKLGFKLS